MSFEKRTVSGKKILDKKQSVKSKVRKANNINDLKTAILELLGEK